MTAELSGEGLMPGPSFDDGHIDRARARGAVVSALCGSSAICPNQYLDLAFDIGKVLGREAELVLFGGSSFGCMGRLAEGVLSTGGKLVGVMPQDQVEMEGIACGAARIVVDSVWDRKACLLSRSDLLLFLPGGTGTLEEFYSALTLARTGQIDGRIALFNGSGFFDPVKRTLEHLASTRFFLGDRLDLWAEMCELQEVVQFITDLKRQRQSGVSNLSELHRDSALSETRRLKGLV